MTEDYVHRTEFDRVVADHERRLKGHDGLYRDLQETREELIRFTEALKEAREQMTSGVTQNERCQEKCVGYRSGFETRIRTLERFRWQIGGALVLIAAVPSWTAVILLLAGGGG